MVWVKFGGQIILISRASVILIWINFRAHVNESFRFPIEAHDVGAPRVPPLMIGFDVLFLCHIQLIAFTSYYLFATTALSTSHFSK